MLCVEVGRKWWQRRGKEWIANDKRVRSQMRRWNEILIRSQQNAQRSGQLRDMLADKAEGVMFDCKKQFVDVINDQDSRHDRVFASKVNSPSVHSTRLNDRRLKHANCEGGEFCTTTSIVFCRFSRDQFVCSQLTVKCSRTSLQDSCRIDNRGMLLTLIKNMKPTKTNGI